MNIVIFIVILVALILAHEFGHFIAAKKSGIRVDEFGIGFPPKLFGVKKGETEYSFNALPFGGFVRIFGENPDVESIEGPDAERSFTSKPRSVQAMVIAAGVAFNVLLAWILISIVYMIGLPTLVDLAPKGASISDASVAIVEVVPDTPARDAGLMPGDEIYALSQGEDFISASDTDSVQEFIQAHAEGPISVSYRRYGEEHDVSIEPIEGIVEGEPAIGISMAMIGNASLPLHRAFFEGARLTAGLTHSTFFSLAGFFKSIFTGGANFDEIAGPVGIVGMVGDVSKQGFAYLLFFTALISINLAIINLIPFPALDGGRLLFLAIETIKGSPIPPRVANTANAIGFLLLILLLVFVTYNDILRITGS